MVQVRTEEVAEIQQSPMRAHSPVACFQPPPLGHLRMRGRAGQGGGPQAQPSPFRICCHLQPSLFQTLLDFSLFPKEQEFPPLGVVLWEALLSTPLLSSPLPSPPLEDFNRCLHSLAQPAAPSLAVHFGTIYSPRHPCLGLVWVPHGCSLEAQAVLEAQAWQKAEHRAVPSTSGSLSKVSASGGLGPHTGLCEGLSGGGERGRVTPSGSLRKEPSV